MKKFLLTAAVAGMFICLPMAANAECNCPCQQQKGEIVVSATSQKEIAPDTVEISIGITTEDSKSMQKAAQENKEISEKVYTALKAMINPANDDFIKTSNYNASAQYKYNNNKRIFDKYEVSNNIILKTKSIDKIGAIIDKASNLGATQINGLNFSVSNYDSQYDNLMEEAAKKAKNRANILAKSTSAMILGVKSVSTNYSSSTNNSPRVYMSAMTLMAADNAGNQVEESSSPIEPGTVKMS